MVFSVVRPNQTPAVGSSRTLSMVPVSPSAQSLPLVFCVWGFHEDAELKYPLASVTMTWASPVVRLVSLKGT